MQILSIDPELNQRCKFRCALDLTSKTYELREIALLRELEATVNIADYRLALINTTDLASALSSIVFLRGRMHSGYIVAYGEFNSLDSETPSRIRSAGADVVLDSRFSTSKIALIISRFVGDTNPPETPTEYMPSWLIRNTLRSIAPAA